METNYKKLDKKAILSWRISGGISFVFFLALLIGIIFFVRNQEEIKEFVYIFYIGAGLMLTYLLGALIIYPEIEYRQWRYLITEDKVEIRHGIFFVTTTVIPIVRVQHITTSRGPIYRKLGLSKVTIFLASGKFDIEGLSEATANTISENLKSKVFERLNKKDGIGV